MRVVLGAQLSTVHVLAWQSVHNRYVSFMAGLRTAGIL